jgi:hypothetical protein
VALLYYDWLVILDELAGKSLLMDGTDCQTFS